MGATSRSQSTDPFSLNKFHVIDTAGVLNVATPAAGFNSLVAPEMNVGIVEYQEGINLYRKKFPGEVTFTALTLTKGVVKNDTSFFKWLLAAAENRPYRTSIIIKHYHRDDVTGLVDYRNASPHREITCYHCVPTRVKLSADFDSLAAEIAIEEVDIELEYFEVKVGGILQAAVELSNPAG